MAGLSIALELLRRGASVTVLERGTVADRATSAVGAAAGMVNPQAHPRVEAPPLRELSLLSRSLYSDWIERIESESGLSCEYDARGGFTVARTEAEEVELDRVLDWQRERTLPFEVLSAEEAVAWEPGLGPEIRAAFHFPLDGCVAPARLGRSLLLAVRTAGALVFERTPVMSLLTDRGRVIGLEVPGGEVRADCVVNAGGAWAGLLSGAPRLPISPVRGQIVCLDASADANRPRRFLHSPDCYLVPRRDGTLIVGSTLERVGYDTNVTAEGISGLIQRASRVLPSLLRYPVLAVWAGLRPGTPDDLPILGETSLPGYFLATGHFKNGVLLAPGSAVVCADLLTGAEPALPVEAFSARRFDR